CGVAAPRRALPAAKTPAPGAAVDRSSPAARDWPAAAAARRRRATATSRGWPAATPLPPGSASAPLRSFLQQDAGAGLHRAGHRVGRPVGQPDAAIGLGLAD